MGDAGIQYIVYSDIDRLKWDRCIDRASNGLIYAYSFYLDYMAEQWDALVLDDYQAAMPLTWNRKFGICYLYQPAFTAHLGIFGDKLSTETNDSFIQSIPKKFRLIEISLNAGNIFQSGSRSVLTRVNYVLPLNANYYLVRGNYRENHRRNVQKALDAGCSIRKDIDVDAIIDLNKKQMKTVAPLGRQQYDHFSSLATFLLKQNKAMTYGVFDQAARLLSSCIFFFSHHRAYYILAGNHPDSRNSGASHLLIDAFIRDHAGTDLVLDFEGSDIESLAFFYSGFGAEKQTYPAIRRNNLPWWMKWMK